MCSSAEQYTGHAGTGGLQGHSLGGIYPYMIVATGDGHWYWQHSADDTKRGRKLKTYDAALLSLAYHLVMWEALLITELRCLLTKRDVHLAMYGGDFHVTADTRRLIYEFIMRAKQ